MRRPGFTLLELVIVIGGLATMTLVFAAVVFGVLRIHQAEEAAGQRLSAQAVVVDSFRADVAGAVEAPDELPALQAGPQCLILRRPNDWYVLYRWDGSRLERTELDDEGESSQRLSLGVEQAKVEFVRSGRLVTLRILESRGTGSVRRERTLAASAALGGDLR